jgi:hypothetical protein
MKPARKSGGGNCNSTFLKLLTGKGKRKREKNDRCNSTVPKIGLCRKAEGYSLEMGSGEKS